MSVAVEPMSQRDLAVDGVSVEVISVDKKLAESWLNMNTNNYRKLNDRHVTMLARDMRNKEFGFTNATIAFDKNGQLVDGQHRLTAIVKADVALPMIVVFDMPIGSASDPSLDTGKKRSTADHLQNRHIANAKDVAAVTRKICSLLATSKLATDQLITDARIVAIAENNADISRAVSKMMAGRKFCPVSISATWFWVANQDAPSLANDFADGFTGARTASTNDPELALREFLLLNRSQKKRITNKELLLYWFSAWERKKANQQVKRLRPVSKISLQQSVQERIRAMKSPALSLVD